MAARVPLWPGNSSAKEFAALVLAKMLGLPFGSMVVWFEQVASESPRKLSQ